MGCEVAHNNRIASRHARPTNRGPSLVRSRLGPVGAVFERFGAVKAGPFTAARLLRDREALLLFPGGGREV